jgi:5-methylcytosine-specific restriction endonuclease McrA
MKPGQRCRRYIERSPLPPRRTPIREVNPVAQAKRYARYKAAIGNAHARRQRKMLKARTRGICESCGHPFTESDPMERGHNTYARLGHELDSDVNGVHRSCNQKERALRKQILKSLKGVRS